jgi:asparagine synthase (glutamine-hydrolysing)
MAVGETLVCVKTDLVELVLVGHVGLSAAELAGWARRITRLTDVDALATSLSGSYHLIAAVEGHIQVHGAISGLRRVYWARVADVAVAGDGLMFSLSSPGRRSMKPRWPRG